jgi:AcrR family transcriptional regulator
LSTEAGRKPARRRMSAAERRELIELRASELFAERGYRGASIEEIARRSGVTPPVVYDHFASKRALYRHLLERHYAELREVWGRNLPGAEPAGERIARSIDAWFAYMEAHPFAARLLFRHNGGDPETDPVHAEVAGASSASVMPLFATVPGAEDLVGPLDTAGMEMAWVVLRGVLQGLALWWSDHPEVPRERVVATAISALWHG